jgi:spore cortex formation protein SpoVR/YcgB (stage V sporulation)
MLKHLACLWGFTVRLESVNPEGRVEHLQECRV